MEKLREVDTNYGLSFNEEGGHYGFSFFWCMHAQRAMRYRSTIMVGWRMGE